MRSEGLKLKVKEQKSRNLSKTQKLPCITSDLTKDLCPYNVSNENIY